MYYTYFDSGTTNTRIYLINNYDIIDFKKQNIGSKDCSIMGSNSVLIKALKELYDQILDNNDLKDDNISNIYASGLVTSPFGFKDISHLSTPVSIRKLYNNIFSYYEPEYFKRKINLIRGVKTIPNNFTVDKYNFDLINNMRGEEIEIFGILSRVKQNLEAGGLCIILPGSHTHIAYIKNGVLQDILSTFSGELFFAISNATILSNSIDININNFDKEMLIIGFEKIKKYGINRALYLVNTMQIFSNLNRIEKTSYLEGIITGGVILSLEKNLNTKWLDVNKIIIAGNSYILKIYEILMTYMYSEMSIKTLIASEKESFAVMGFQELLKIGGI